MYKGEAEITKRPKSYDTTVARMAGNIAAGIIGDLDEILDEAYLDDVIVKRSVKIAQAIVQQLTDEANEE